MTELIKVVDNFCSKLEEVRASALESGFGTWAPNQGQIGSSKYEGMNFWGRHSFMLGALHLALHQPVFPNSMFFRATNVGFEKAYVHSDREWGSKTCIAYLSEHEPLVSGTAFYRHCKSGLTEMPTMADLTDPQFEQLKDDMVNPTPEAWEQLDFVRGVRNRALIFHAPLFHSRVPNEGIGSSPEDGRMIWGCHFHTADSLAHIA